MGKPNSQQDKGTNLVQPTATGPVVLATTIPTLSDFGTVELSRPDTLTVYPNKTGKSVGAAKIAVPFQLLAGTFSIAATLYGRLKDDGGVKFEVSLPKGIMTGSDERIAFRAHVNKAILLWSQWPAVKRAAYAALIAPPKSTSAADAKAGAAMEFSADDLAEPVKPEGQPTPAPESELEAGPGETQGETQAA